MVLPGRRGKWPGPGRMTPEDFAAQRRWSGVLVRLSGGRIGCRVRGEGGTAAATGAPMAHASAVDQPQPALRPLPTAARWSPGPAVALPRPLTCLVGRERELAAVRDVLR